MAFARSNLADISQPFFDGCARGELLVPKCERCGKLFFYPSVLCQHCHSPEWDWEPMSGDATVYSFTELHRPVGDMQAPYIVAVVELAEGVRMMTNIVGDGAHDVSLGDPVRVRFGDSWDGRRVPLFERT
jgi:uncharacterized OB-fold protein